MLLALSVIYFVLLWIFFFWCTDSPALFLLCCITLKPGVRGNERDEFLNVDTMQRIYFEVKDIWIVVLSED